MCKICEEVAFFYTLHEKEEVTVATKGDFYNFDEDQKEANDPEFYDCYFEDFNKFYIIKYDT